MGAALGRPQPAAEPPKRRPRLDIHTLPQEILLHAFSFLTTVQRSPGRPASPTSVAVKTLLRSRFVLGLVSADFEAAMRTHKSAHPRAWFPALYGAVPGDATVGELRSRAAAARHRNLVDVLARRHATERRRPADAARAASRPVDLGTLKELSVIAFDRMLDHLAGRSWQLLVHDVRLVHRGGDHAPETAAVREASDAARALFAGQAAPWRASWPPLARARRPTRAGRRAAPALARRAVLIAEAGAIPPLVELLRDGSADAKSAGRAALRNLACMNAANRVLIAEAGGIPPLLVELLRDGRPAHTKQWAAAALFNIARDNDANAVAIAVAVSLEALVELARAAA
ncbi:hypothetical protein SO694_00141029 [Aureococcus anophagefferens]|uniref:F-box domain-containing protein n=1 Tax=Aureococcus anophagefferens TaxID=44056 RepID=A0ABR1FPE5_AURAN